jgi:hypothetical protein
MRPRWWMSMKTSESVRMGVGERCYRDRERCASLRQAEDSMNRFTSLRLAQLSCVAYDPFPRYYYFS